MKGTCTEWPKPLSAEAASKRQTTLRARMPRSVSVALGNFARFLLDDNDTLQDENKEEVSSSGLWKHLDAVCDNRFYSCC